MHELPEVIIVGAAKAGTTSLYDALCTNQEIYSSNIKEPNFHFFHGMKSTLYSFNQGNKTKINPPNYSIERNYYYRLYSNRGGKIAIDASPIYLFKDTSCIASIKHSYQATCNQPKIIIVLRNPIDRAWSHYLHHVRIGEEIREFENVIQEYYNNEFDIDLWPGWDYINQGFYSESIQNYKQAFKNVKVIFFDDFVNNYQNSMNDINKFIGLEDKEYRQIKSNISGIPKNGILGLIWKHVMYSNTSRRIYSSKYFPIKKQIIKKARDRFAHIALNKKRIPKAYKEILKEIYAVEIRKLEKDEGRSLSHWLK